jgi:hypothetical protein
MFVTIETKTKKDVVLLKTKTKIKPLDPTFLLQNERISAIDYCVEK